MKPLFQMRHAELAEEIWSFVSDSWQRCEFDEYMRQKSEWELRKLLARYRGGQWLTLNGQSGWVGAQ